MQQEKKESCSFFFFIPTPKTIFFIFIFGNFNKDFALEKKNNLNKYCDCLKRKQEVEWAGWPISNIQQGP